MSLFRPVRRPSAVRVGALLTAAFVALSLAVPAAATAATDDTAPELSAPEFVTPQQAIPLDGTGSLVNWISLEVTPAAPTRFELLYVRADGTKVASKPLGDAPAGKLAATYANNSSLAGTFLVVRAVNEAGEARTDAPPVIAELGEPTTPTEPSEPATVVATEPTPDEFLIEKRDVLAAPVWLEGPRRIRLGEQPAEPLPAGWTLKPLGGVVTAQGVISSVSPVTFRQLWVRQGGEIAKTIEFGTVQPDQFGEVRYRLNWSWWAAPDWSDELISVVWEATNDAGTTRSDALRPGDEPIAEEPEFTIVPPGFVTPTLAPTTHRWVIDTEEPSAIETTLIVQPAALTKFTALYWRLESGVYFLQASRHLGTGDHGTIHAQIPVDPSLNGLVVTIQALNGEGYTTSASPYDG